MKTISEKRISIDGIEFLITIDNIGESNFELDFSIVDGERLVFRDKTLTEKNLKGKQNPLRVFRRVMDIFINELLPEFMATNPDATLVFEAEPKRAQLYKRVIGKMGATMAPWDEVPGMFVIIW